MARDQSQKGALVTIRWRWDRRTPKPTVGHWIRRFNDKQSLEIVAVQEMRGQLPRGENFAVTCARRRTREIPPEAMVHSIGRQKSDVTEQQIASPPASFIDQLYEHWDASDGPETYPDGEAQYD